MDESKFEIPAWLPWATTACLAALVACLGELLIVDKARNQLSRDQGLLADAAIKGMENQMEAERIVSARALAAAGQPAGSVEGLQVILLSPPIGETAEARAPAAGAVVLEAAGGRALATLAGGQQSDPGRQYDLWLEDSGSGHPSFCCALGRASLGDTPAMPFKLTAPLAPGFRFIVVSRPEGAARAPDGAETPGPIVLASTPVAGKN